MTRALYFFQQRLSIVRRVCEHVLVRILRKTAPSLLERKLKTTENSIANSPIGLYFTDGSNFYSDFLRVDIMPEVKHTTGEDECCKVEYLETPVKSENDKKEYR